MRRLLVFVLAVLLIGAAVTQVLPLVEERGGIGQVWQDMKTWVAQKMDVFEVENVRTLENPTYNEQSGTAVDKVLGEDMGLFGPHGR